MTISLAVSEHAGQWILRTGARTFVVPDRVGRALASRQEEEISLPALRRTLTKACPADADLSGLLVALADETSGSRRRALWLRFPLIPAGVVVRVAARVRPLAAWPMLIAAGVSGLAAFVWFAELPGPLARSDHLAALALFVLTALWHETGHAAALARGGLPPGAIGVGLLFVMPVLYADVSLLGALGRIDRVRVDLAGVAFQSGAAGLLCFLGTWWPAARLAAWIALAAVAWSLLPFIRSDGYWLLCDLLGVRRLEPESGQGRGLAVLLHGFRVMNFLFLAAVAAVMATRLVSLARYLGSLF